MQRGGANGNGGWVGVVIDGKALGQKWFNPVVTLRLDGEGEVWNVEFAAVRDKVYGFCTTVLVLGWWWFWWELLMCNVGGDMCRATTRRESLLSRMRPRRGRARC